LKRMMPALAGWLALSLSMPSGSAILLETSELLATTPEAAALLPAAREFTIASAGNYVVSLRDLGEPASLRSLEALVTRDLRVVAKLDVEYPASGTVPPVTATFAGTPGIYRVHVLGTIPSGAAGGTFGITVAPSAGGGAVFEAVDAIAANEGPAAGQSVLQTKFTVTAAGSYQLAIADRAFPAALASTNVLLLRQTATSPEIALTAAGTFNASANETYELIVIATAGATQAGLYGVSVTGGPSNAVIYRSDNTVGQLPPATAFNVAAAGSYALTLTDLDFPQALTSLAAAVTQNGAFAGSRTGAGAGNLTLSEGAAELFVFATSPAAGAMTVSLMQGAQVAYADVHLSDASPEAATPAIYSFKPSQPVAAGNYTLTVSDFRFPTPLAALETAVVQGSSIVYRAEDAVAAPVVLSAGAVRVMVAATPPPGSAAAPGNGMFGMTLTTQPGNAVVFESTQGVGGLFYPRTVDLPAAGRYDVSLADFEFPARLRTSWLAITRGTTLVGQIIGSGSIQNEQLQAGGYVLNFLAQPADGSAYGAFGLKVADAPPPPVVTLSASPLSVASGSQTTLQWSATNATSCTASGGWTGAKATSGSQQSGALTANSTFEIECVGPSGRDDASVTITIATSSNGSGGGGGGQVDLLLLLGMLAVLLAARASVSLRRREGASRREHAIQ
jgi:hypothetical protein